MIQKRGGKDGEDVLIRFRCGRDDKISIVL